MLGIDFNHVSYVPFQDMDSDDDFDFEELRQKWQANRKGEFNFDEWAKEIDNHPAFMTKPPEGSDLSEAAAAIQALKYDEEDDAEVQAKAYKDDGNKNFELKKYRWAIDCYTKGIALRCPDAKLNAVLYANRAASHFRLENYRSSLKDCVLARKFDPDHWKATMRGIDSLLKLRQPIEALEWIKDMENVSNLEKKSLDLAKLKSEATYMMKLIARDERRLKKEAETGRNEKLVIMNALKVRNVRFREPINLMNPDKFEWSKLEVNLPGMESVVRVHFDESENDVLVWPVLLLYPSIGETDFIREFRENDTLQDHMSVIFATPPPWDENMDIDSIQIYFESFTHPGKLIMVPFSTALATVLSHPEYAVAAGCPNFLIYSSRSPTCQEFLSRQSISSM